MSLEVLVSNPGRAPKYVTSPFCLGVTGGVTYTIKEEQNVSVNVKKPVGKKKSLELLALAAIPALTHKETLQYFIYKVESF